MLIVALQPHEPPDPVTAISVLQAARGASGGSAWSRARWIEADGRKTSYGLNGTYREVVDTTSGYFKREARYPEFANAEGMNAIGRWREDNSGAIHLLDSREASTVAKTESYLARRGYFFADPTTKTVLLAPAEDAGLRYERVEVIPEGGRAAVLWFDQTDHLLARVVMQLSERVETIHYGDYRRAYGLRLPFRIDTDDGDEADTGSATIASYRVAAPAWPQELSTPILAADATISSASRRTSVPMRGDANGFLVLFANVNGRGPFPFILDTGGHDIVTPVFAQALGLTLAGSGKSYGAGSGSTPTSFTTIDELTIGDARIMHQPFTVLYLDLGRIKDSAGKDEPIAGILGLEFFERFTVGVDFVANVVTLAMPGAPPPRAVVSVPIRFTSDMPLADASLDGVRGSFGIDLGNNVGLILFEHWLASNGLTGRVQPMSSMRGQSVGGAVAMRMTDIRGFTLGSVNFPSLRGFIANSRAGSFSARSEAGNLGTPVLTLVRRATFDYARQMLYLEPRS